jgi:hypothetical protein
MAANRRQHNTGGATGPVATEPRHGFRAIGVATSTITAPILARRRGGFLVRLKSEWATIVGGEWALRAWPVAFGRDGTLKLRSAPGCGLELQHLAPLLIERINLYFGRPVVVRLTQMQGPLPLPAVSPPPPPPPVAAVAAIEEQVAGVPDPELRAALVRLGRALATDRF